MVRHEEKEIFQVFQSRGLFCLEPSLQQLPDLALGGLCREDELSPEGPVGTFFSFEHLGQHGSDGGLPGTVDALEGDKISSHDH